MKNKFENANEAFEYFLNEIRCNGVEFGDTKALFNVGFYLNNPTLRAITTKERKWSVDYAEAEWQWYLSGDPNISKLGEIYGKIPPLSIYDAKEHPKYKNDTPCTYAIQFTIIDGELCMSVYMRSNDLWYGFCNDQYQFSQLQQLVASMLDIEIGWYYHHAHNLHLYNNKL